MNSKIIFKTIGLFAVALSLTSCKQEPKDKDNALIEVTDSISSLSHESLYKHVKEGNEVILSFVRNGDVVKGQLDYNLREKDRNTGTIEGVVKGDLLIADYVFMSEGVTSTRQVVFKIENNALIEGDGDIEEKDGKMVFKDVNQLNFNPDFRLELVK